ncbi:MAG: MarR family transcriptional regulator [Clostridia bacterium]|nr:MarR family transcriptional regulator [Clostridia bacterium]
METKDFYVHLLKMARELNRSFEKKGNRSELNHTEEEALNAVRYATLAGEKIISTQIAEQIGITRSAVSQMLDKLEQQGYVVRTAAENDRKIAYIELTDREKERLTADFEEEFEVLSAAMARVGEEKSERLFNRVEKFFQLEQKIKKRKSK